ncbi:MAG: hypothetical protein ACOZQL_35745 [Myxococcota bacterium]
MIRLLSLVTLAASSIALADPPHFSSGGFTFQLQYGPGFWTFDRAKLAAETEAQDPTGADAFVSDLQNTHTVSVSMAYNILGHASIGADLTATGWNLFDTSRGGGGFAIGKLAWHPVELFFLNKEKRPIGFDMSTWFGVGYGIVGQRRGMDGLLFEWGVNLDYFFTKYFGLGFVTRGIFFNWEKFYLDYNNRDQPGATVTLSKPSGGSFWTFGLTLTFRAGE